MGNDGNIYIIYIYGIIMGVEVRQLEFEHPKLVWHDGDTTLMGLWMRAGNGVVEFLTIFEAVIWEDVKRYAMLRMNWVIYIMLPTMCQVVLKAPNIAFDSPSGVEQ